MLANVSSAIGFLSEPDPLRTLPAEFEVLDALAGDLPTLISNFKFRQLSKKLPEFDFANVQDEDVLERLMLVYSYFASAYVWGAPGDEPEKVLPANVAVPLVHLAERLNRKPILSYASYCLFNWRRIDESKPIALGNIELLQKFVPVYDEDWFILVHVDIEAKGGAIVDAIMEARGATYREEDEALYQALVELSRSIAAANRTLARMPEKCSPEVYFNKVRPYIFGFDNLIYEGCFDDKPQRFRGETGAQSSLVPLIQIALGVTHRASILTQHLEDMRNYMPRVHRNYLAEMEKSVVPYGESPGVHPGRFDIRKRVIESKKANMRDAYNDCVKQLWEFRNKHFEYAVEYIHKKVSNPSGTGGTPFMDWLKQLRNETADFLLKGESDDKD